MASVVASGLRRRGFRAEAGFGSISRKSLNETKQLAKSNDWAKLALYGYLLTVAGTAVGGWYNMIGTLALFPRIFFPLSLLLQGTFLNIFWWFVIAEPGTLYVQIRWDIQRFNIMAVLGYIFEVQVAWAFLYSYGNKRDLQPFESPNDLGTSYLTVNYIFFVVGIAMTWISLITVSSYAHGTNNPAEITCSKGKIIKIKELDLNNT